MDFFDTVAGREFSERVMRSLEDIAESLDVIANYIITNQDKDGSIDEE